MNYTSINQSKHLLKLGLNPETADMHWIESEYINEDTGEPLKQYALIAGQYYEQPLWIPCWSVRALFNLMPFATYRIDKVWTSNGIRYRIFCINLKGNLDTDYQTPDYDNLIEACYNMVVWLLKNNYIKND